MSKSYKELALEYYNKHQKHVNDLQAETTREAEVSSEDLHYPGLWKGIHWNWFFEKEIKEVKSE